MWLDYAAAAAAMAISIWLLVSGFDDLFVALIGLVWAPRPVAWPSEEELRAVPEHRIAILIPLWHEHQVIGPMLESNLAAIEYENYDIFAGVYPNDDATARVVAEVAARHPRVHMAVCPRPGPTSKADCLNAIWRAVREFEQDRGAWFDLAVMHDAEDLVHRRALRLINWFSRDYDMVQIPVLPLRMSFGHLTHGLYCDEFADFQLKDFPARRRMGGFIPGNGVGTGIVREALERLAPGHLWRVFDPECLTEDYELGFRLHSLGFRQLPVDIRFEAAGPIATREYFPAALKAAVRQRSRWVTGIVLQGWQRHGWRVPLRQRYWLWRDRKGLIGNLLCPVANLVSIYGMFAWNRLAPLFPAWAPVCFAVTFGLSCFQIAIRTVASARIYGWRFAAGVPVRLLWGNAVNFLATARAIRRFADAALHRKSLAWSKTEHAYPAPASRAARPRVGEVLVRMSWASRREIEAAVSSLPPGRRLGEHLVSAGIVSEHQVYRALSLQTGIPLGLPADRDLDPRATRVLPVDAMRRWKVLPYRVAAGQLHVLTPELPSEAMAGEIAHYSTLAARYRLVLPKEFESVAGRYLPVRAAS